MRSIKKYWMAVELDVKTTQVLEVATATEGSTPISKKKGEKMRPPPILRKGSRQRYCDSNPALSFGLHNTTLY